MLEQKDEDFLVLLKEYNYLNTVSKETKSRLAKLMEEYKYLSIQNRTLLGVRQKLVEKELECTKIKGEKEVFRKKIIGLLRQLAEKEEEKS